MKKPWWKSYTVWGNGLVLLAASLPPVQRWIHQDPIHNVQFLAMWNVVQRFVTQQGLSLRGEDVDESISD